jgi:hypothetical protein
MKNRGCFLLLLLALAVKTITVSAQASAVQVQVYDYTGLSPAALHELTSRTQAILASSGASLEVDACARGNALCESSSGSSRRVVIRVVPEWGKNKTSASLKKLGMSVAGQNGGDYGTVFFKAAEEMASEANLPPTTVLAYAAAHEVGHLLLGAQAHTSRGLMKATWEGDDFRAMAQNDFYFSPQQARELSARYGRSHGAGPGTNTPIAAR